MMPPSKIVRDLYIYKAAQDIASSAGTVIKSPTLIDKAKNYVFQGMEDRMMETVRKELPKLMDNVVVPKIMNAVKPYAMGMMGISAVMPMVQGILGRRQNTPMGKVMAQKGMHKTPATNVPLGVKSSPIRKQTWHT